MIEKVIVLGNGVAAKGCVKTAAQRGYMTEFYTVDMNGEKVISENYNFIQPKIVTIDEMASILCRQKQKVLVVSAANQWIIPTEVLENDYIIAINFHNALLPKHPGRHAEAWAIYEGDNKTGITWHRIDPKVDSGDIIIQKEIPIDDKSTSLSLLQQQNKMALEAFENIVDSVLEERCTYIKQETSHSKFHYSWEIPNQGLLETEWHGKKISAFLRAMDYGILKTMGNPKISFNNLQYCWKRYKIVSDESASILEKKEDNIVIVKDGFRIELIGVYEI